MEKGVKSKKKVALMVTLFVLPVMIRGAFLLFKKVDFLSVEAPLLLFHLCLSFFSSLSMYCYLKKEKRLRDIYPCSLAYGMSGFALSFALDIPTAIVFGLFPILYYCFEKSQDNIYRLGYLILMSGLLIFNPPVSFGVFLVLLLVELGHAVIGSSKDDSISKASSHMIRFLSVSLVSFLLAAFAWIPDFFNRFILEKSVSWRNFHLSYDIWGLLSRFFVMSGDAAGMSVLQGSNLYCSVTAFVLCIFYLFSPGKDIRKKLISVLGILGGLSLVFVRPLYDLFTAFSDQEGVSTSLGFIAVFFILKEAASAEEKHLKSISYKRLVLLSFGISCVTLATCRFAINSLKNESVFITMILVTGVLMTVIFYRRGSISDISFKMIIAVLMVTELMINTYEVSDISLLSGQSLNMFASESDSGEKNSKMEVIYNPFDTIEGTVPQDLRVSSGLEDVSILQYDSGVVALDSHKVAGQFPMIIIRYRFEAQQDGVLYIKHGDELKRYGIVKKHELIDCDSIHDTRTNGVEYESVKVCYVDENKEALAIEKQERAMRQEQTAATGKKTVAFWFGVGISVLTALGLVILKKKLCIIENGCIKLWERRRYKTIPMGIKAFLIPFAILILACIYAGVKPFGENTFWHGDGLALTMPTMFQARDQIMRGSFFYSFSAGGGSNLYYFNPALFLFFWLILIPEHMLAEVIGYVILFKVALCASSMYLYLSRSKNRKGKRGNQEYSILLFTTAYALSSYQLCLTSYFYWSDIVLLLPLILLAMERMLDQKKPAAYSLLLALAMVLNCYNAIYICLFLVFWFFTTHFGDVRDFLRKGMMFSLYSLLSAGMSFWVIFATLLSRKYGFYAENDKSIPVPSFFQSFWITLRQFFIAADSISGTDQNGMCNLYCGIFVCLLLLYGFFVNKKVKKYHYRILLCIFVLVSTNTSTLDYIWNGFHYQNNMPGRYTFLIVFLLTDLAWDTMGEIYQKGVERKGVIGCLVSAIVMGIMAASKGEAGVASVAFTVTFFVIYAGILINRIGKRQDREGGCIRLLLTGVVLTELLVNTCYIFGNYASLRNLYAYRDLSGWIKEYDPDMTGLDRTAFLGSANANFGESSDLGSLGIFNSFLTPQQFLLGSSLGMAATDNMIRENYNMSPMSNAMGRVKYIIVPRVLEATGVDLDGYKVIRETDRLILLENKNLIPEGFFLSSQMKERMDRAIGREELLNVLSEGIIGKKVFDKAIPLKRLENGDDAIKEKQVFLPEEVIHENFINTKIILDIMDTGYYYWGGVCYASLGKIQERGPYETERILMQPEVASLLRFSRENFMDFLTEINRNGLSSVKVSDGKMQGGITTEEEGYLCLPIPYEPGWKAVVNRKEADISEMRNGMMAVKLPVGENRIELTFIPNGLITGILISVLSFIAFWIVQLLRWYRERKTGKELRI